MAPQISLPWVIAFTITCGPGPAALEGVDEVDAGGGPAVGVDVGSGELDGDSGHGGQCSSLRGGWSCRGRVVVMVVIVPMVVAMVVVMAMIVIAAVVVVVARGAAMRAALGRVVADRLHQALDVPRQAREAGRLLSRALVQVEPAVQLDLQAVASVGRIGERAHELDALVGIVDLHVVAHVRERARDERGESGLAGGAVAVAEDEVGPRLPRAFLGDHAAHAPASNGSSRATPSRSARATASSASLTAFW